MKSTIRIDVSPVDNRPIISIKSVTTSDDLRDKALINFLDPILIKKNKGKGTYLHIQHKSNFAGTISECGDHWEVSSFNRDMSVLDQISGMYRLLCHQTGNTFVMCNGGNDLCFENLETGKRSEYLNIDHLEDLDYHSFAGKIEENFKSIIPVKATSRK